MTFPTFEESIRFEEEARIKAKLDPTAALAQFTREQLEAELASRGFNYREVLEHLRDPFLKPAEVTLLARAVLAGERPGSTRPSVIEDQTAVESETLRIAQAFTNALNAIGKWSPAAGMHAALVLALHIAERMGSDSHASALAHFLFIECEGRSDEAMNVLRTVIARHAAIDTMIGVARSGGPS